MAVVKLQKLLSSAKRCVFEIKWNICHARKEKSCKHLYAARVCEKIARKKINSFAAGN